MSVSSGPYGYEWNALSINIEGIFNSTYPQAIWNGLTGKQKAWGDTPSIVVGEWGTQNGNFSVGDISILSMYLGIRLFFPTMYFFSHQWANEASPTHRSYGTTDSSNVDTSNHTHILGGPEE